MEYWKYKGREEDQKLLEYLEYLREKEQLSEKDYRRLIHWHYSLMWYVGEEEVRINDMERTIRHLQ